MARKMILLLAAVTGACLAFPIVAAAAGITGTAHDIITYSSITDPALKKSGACSFCHVPHKAAGAKLWSSTLDTSGSGWRTEVVSQLCWSCHNGGSSLSGAQEVNPFGATNKHGQDLTSLTAWGDVSALPISGVEASAADSTKLKCTSCHNVHSNDAKPFLNFMTAGSTDFHVFCTKCHPNRANTGSYGTANTGNHPVNILVADGHGGSSDMQGTINAAFAVATTGTATMGDWNLGGHLSNGTTNFTTGNFNCGSCHAVHGNETATFSSAADGPTSVTSEVTGYNKLGVMDTVPPTAAAGLTPICIGCHASNPGAAAKITHPVGTVATAWKVAIGTAQGYLWGNDGAGNRVIDCQSCHDIHFTVSDPASIDAREGATASNAYLLNWSCQDCHGSTLAGHHVSNVTPSAGWSFPINASSATAWGQGTATQTASGKQYALVGGVMVCNTCHANAHNRDYATGLPGTNAESDACVDCHTINPSVKTANAHAGTQSSTVTTNSTHYVGTIGSTAYKRTAAFSSGATPKYSPDGTNGSIICESCHTINMKQGATTVTARVSSNTAVSGSVSSAVGNLLEVSGNLRTGYDQSGATPPTGTVDMCTGCHASAPGGGSTHPVLSNMTTSATMTPTAPATLSGNTRINCESCHRPHDAAGGSGSTILEGAGTDSTKTAFQGVGATHGSTGGYVNEQVLCQLCHSY